MSVVVLGSLNMDLVVRAPRLPRAGETITGGGFFTAAGGKGANQAVACARLGTPTRLLGRVGDDGFGRELTAGLARDGVDLSGVTRDARHSTGVALITVDQAGENSIVIVPGANGAVGAEELEKLGRGPAGERVLLLQLEVPLETVAAAARAARERGLKVVLDPAPVRPLPDELWPLIDVLTPNETEAQALVGFALEDRDAIERAARHLLDQGARGVVIKLGGRGAYWSDGRHSAMVPAFPVEAVDTVAAGDAFNGALAVALAEDRPLDQALRRAAAAGALSATRAGAQPSLPRRGELETFLAGH